MTKNRTPTPVYLDPGMHPGLEVKGLITTIGFLIRFICQSNQLFLQMFGIKSFGSANVWYQIEQITVIVTNLKLSQAQMGEKLII